MIQAPACYSFAMRLLWLILLAVPIACGVSEPAAPSGGAYPAPPPAAGSGSPAPPPAGRGPSDAAPAPFVVPDASAPSAPSAENVVPTWILETIGPIRPRLAQCYVAGLAKEPGMVGTVMLAVGIDREGKMTASAGASGTVAPAVVACVVGHLMKTRFAPPPGQAPMALALPIHFRNNPADGPSVSVGKLDPGY